MALTDGLNATEGQMLSTDDNTGKSDNLDDDVIHTQLTGVDDQKASYFDSEQEKYFEDKLELDTDDTNKHNKYAFL